MLGLRSHDCFCLLSSSSLLPVCRDQSTGSLMSWATTVWLSTPNLSACSSPERPPVQTQPSPGPMARSFSLRETSTGEWTSCWVWTEDTLWALRSAGCAARAETLEGSRLPGVDLQWLGITNLTSLHLITKLHLKAGWFLWGYLFYYYCFYCF